MKTMVWTFAILAALTMATNSAFAGIEKFNSNEFNSLINENLKAEKELQKELQNHAGIKDPAQSVQPNFAEKGKRMVGIMESESVVAPSNIKHNSHVPAQRGLIKKDLERVSQEIESSDAE